jgi:hypothetical protein
MGLDKNRGQGTGQNHEILSLTKPWGNFSPSTRYLKYQNILFIVYKKYSLYPLMSLSLSSLSISHLSLPRSISLSFINICIHKHKYVCVCVRVCIYHKGYYRKIYFILFVSFIVHQPSYKIKVVQKLTSLSSTHPFVNQMDP